MKRMFKSIISLALCMLVFKGYNQVCNLSGDIYFNYLSCDSLQFNGYLYSSNNNVVFYWFLGDGTTAYNTSVVYHKYSSSGTYEVTLHMIDTLNPTCRDSVKEVIKIDPAPIVDIVANQISSSKYIFNANITPTGSGKFYVDKWDFGDGIQLSVDVPMYNFNNLGSYNVVVYVKNQFVPSYYCYYTDTHRVTITQIDTCGLIAYFNTYTTSGYDCFSRNFNLSISGVPEYSFYISFGDGDTIYDQMNPIHTFPQSGEYNVTLSANALGNPSCQVTYQRNLMIPPSISGGFTYNISNLEVTFNAENTQGGSGIYAFEYNFGDGSYGYSQNMTHQYPDYGQYIVVLTIYDQQLSSCTKIYVDTIVLIPPCNMTVTAQVNHETYSGANNGSIILQPSNYYGHLTYQWSTFSSGTTQYLMNLAPGTYYYTVSNQYGCMVVGSATVLPYCSATIFAGHDITHSCMGDTIHLSESFVEGANFVHWSAIGGNGWFTHVDSLHTKFIPQTAGTFYLILENHSTCAGVLRDTLVLTVYPKPDGILTASAASVFDGDTVILSVSGGDSYYWTFSGDTVNQVAVVVLGTNVYQVNTYNIYGCFDIDTMTIYSQPRPTCYPYFDYWIDNLDNKGIYFYAYAEGPGFIYEWDFGDGQIITGIKNPYHKYVIPGTYQVCLKVSNTIVNCDTMLCMVVHVGQSGNCWLTFNYEETAQPGQVKFCVYGNNISNIFWNFGDGQTLTQTNINDTIIHVYPGEGTYHVCVTSVDTAGSCFSTWCSDIIVGQACFAVIKFTYDSLNNNYRFNATLSGNVQGPVYYWTFGNGTYSQAINPVVQLPNGINQVCVSIYDTVTNCFAYACKDIFVGQNFCIADFNFYVENQTVYFVNNSYSAYNNGMNSINYYWNFGDGYTSMLENPVYSYMNPGIYNVSLSVRDLTANCYAYKEKQIVIGNGPCNAQFTYFYDLSTGNVSFYPQTNNDSVAYFWNFGDGNFSNEKFPQHQYANPGMYYVTLNVFTNNGDVCFSQRFVQIGNVDCNAYFSVFVDTTTNAAYFFHMNTGSMEFLHWDFGDGSFSNEENPVHYYPNEGYYNVSLSVTTTNGSCVDNFSKTVVIGSQGMDCEANFYYYSDFIMPTVYFYDYSWGNPISWLWDFGDGSYSTDKNPIHTYSESGYYYVCLTVRNVSGITNSTCMLVKAGNDANTCYADFIYTVDSASKKVTFKDMSLGNPDLWFWNFGDGNISNSKNPIHTYSSEGYYLVSLAVINTSNNCYSYNNYLINVGMGDNGLVADFGYLVDSTSKSNQRPVSFKGTGFGDPARYAWNFGDGERDTTNLRPTHVYNVPYFPYTYNVCLTIWDPVTGDSSTACKDLTFDMAVSNKSTIINNSPTYVRNFPNPFNKNTSIVYNLSNDCHVNISLYDLLGNKLTTISDEYKQKGFYVMKFSGENLANGIYLLKMTVGGESYITRMVVVE